jgi:hypothetical protein
MISEDFVIRVKRLSEKKSYVFRNRCDVIRAHLNDSYSFW